MTHLDELLSAAKSLDEAPPPEAGARMWAKVAARVGGGAAIGVAVATAGAKSASAASTAAASTAATAGATVTSSLGLTLAKVGVGLALTAGIGVGVATVARDPEPEAPTTEAVVAERDEAPPRKTRTTAPEAVVEMPASPEEPEVVIEITEETPAPKAKARARKRPEPAPEPAPELAPASALAAESDLLGKAKVAASSGRNQDALRAIRQHAQTYPNGELAEVRRALEVKVLCKLGRTDAARTAAERFLKRHGSSALAGQVRQSCAYEE